MKLFESVEDLQKSGFLFRITDNGGETADRYTIMTCDGDALVTGSYCGGWAEGIDVQILSDDVEAGTQRDLRWIDLPADIQRSFIATLNDGFEYYIESEAAAASRDEARDWEGQWEAYSDNRTPIYRDGDGFRIRDDERARTRSRPCAHPPAHPHTAGGRARLRPRYARDGTWLTNRRTLLTLFVRDLLGHRG